MTIGLPLSGYTTADRKGGNLTPTRSDGSLQPEFRRRRAVALEAPVGRLDRNLDIPLPNAPRMSLERPVLVRRRLGRGRSAVLQH